MCLYLSLNERAVSSYPLPGLPHPHVYMESLEIIQDKSGYLIKWGMAKILAYQWGNTRKGYWRIADSPLLERTIDNCSLHKAGYATLMDHYLE